MEIICTLNELSIQTRHPIVVVNWTSEESKRFSSPMLQQVEVLVGQGMRLIDAIQEVSITEQTYYGWRKKEVGRHRA